MTLYPFLFGDRDGRMGELLLDIYDLYRWNVSLTAISLFSGEATPSLIFQPSDLK